MKQCSHFSETLSEDHRYFVNSSNHSNCVFCLIDDKGKMTQEEVGRYFDLTKMRISQLEKQALDKFKKKMKLFSLGD